MRLIDADKFIAYLEAVVKGEDTFYVQLMEKFINMVEIVADNEPINQWISCSERLPKYGQPVLTYNLKDEEYEINHIIDEEDGEWFIYGVDAWQPLPDPWKGEEE